MQKLFIINGRGTSGKDTFVNLLKDIDGNVVSVSSVSEIKLLAAQYFGYTGDKTDKERKLLSDLKLLQTEACDGPFNYMMHHIATDPFSHLFFHIREPEEIAKFKAKTGALTILIERTEIDRDFGNMADDGVANYDYDLKILNCTLSGLEASAQIFHDTYIKGNKV